MVQSWETLARQVVFDQSPWLVVEQHTVRLPDGRSIPNWPWVITPDYINVVVLTESGLYLCFRQHKYGVPAPMLALVGGYIKPGEEPLAAAQRELREETGYAAEDWVELGHFLVDPNRGMATGHLYLARQARQVCAPDSDDLEEQEVVMLSRSELEQALSAGEFKILAWATAVALALRV
ncbi:MAG: NUDIX hydrolase [Anaerolineales bacterium]|nr:NUDIX hydrolase [Anaerolineales bacterium]